jgi:hypothetical protein
MDGKDIWWTYWYFHIPNYALSVVFYCLFGRFALSFFLPAHTKNYIFRSFVWLTQWIVRPAAFLTPSAMPSILMPPIAAFWVVVLRLALFTALYAAGLLPRAPAQQG